MQMIKELTVKDIEDMKAVRLAVLVIDRILPMYIVKEVLDAAKQEEKLLDVCHFLITYEEGDQLTQQLELFKRSFV